MTTINRATRALHLVDIENLLGGPLAAAGEVEQVLDHYLDLRGVAAGRHRQHRRKPRPRSQVHVERASRRPRRAACVVLTAPTSRSSPPLPVRRAPCRETCHRKRRLHVSSRVRLRLERSGSAYWSSPGRALYAAVGTHMASRWSPLTRQRPSLPRNPSLNTRSHESDTENQMETNIRFDHHFLAVESENTVHCMLELVVPDAATASSVRRSTLHLVLDRSGLDEPGRSSTSPSSARHSWPDGWGPKVSSRLSPYDDQVELVRPLVPVDVRDGVRHRDDLPRRDPRTSRVAGWRGSGATPRERRRSTGSCSWRTVSRTPASSTTRNSSRSPKAPRRTQRPRRSASVTASTKTCSPRLPTRRAARPTSPRTPTTRRASLRKSSTVSSVDRRRAERQHRDLSVGQGRAHRRAERIPDGRRRIRCAGPARRRIRRRTAPGRVRASDSAARATRPGHGRECGGALRDRGGPRCHARDDDSGNHQSRRRGRKRQLSPSWIMR